MDYVICRVNARVGAVVPIQDYLLETQNKHRHTCLNNCTAFKKILATQELLIMNVQSFEGVQDRKSNYFSTNSRKLSPVKEAA